MNSEVPEEWLALKLENTVEILDSKRIPLNSEERYNMGGNIPYYGANGVVDYINNYIFDEDLILMAEDGGNFDEYQNRPIAYRIRGKSWVNNHAHVLRVKAGFAFDYIFYSIEHKNIISIIKGGTRTKLNQAELKEIPILVPKSIKEQQKIAAILQTVDKTIDKTKTLIEKYKKIKQGLMQDLFTRGVDENGKPNTEFRDSELGKIPEGWNIKKLGEITLKIADRDHYTPEYVERGIPMISPKDFDENDKIKFSSCKYISIKEHLHNKRKTDISVDDLIFTRIGALLGKICLVTPNMPEFSILHSAAMIRANKIEVIPEFLLYSIKHHYFQKRIIREIQSIGVPDLGLDKIYNFKIKIPSDKKEQEKIAKILESIDNKIEAEQSYLDKLIKIKSGLMQDLLTGKVRVAM